MHHRDIDDTMMQTGAYSLARNLWTTFTGSALTRDVFPDAVALMTRLHDGMNPVFYVSSAPVESASLSGCGLRAGGARAGADVPARLRIVG